MKEERVKLILESLSENYISSNVSVQKQFAMKLRKLIVFLNIMVQLFKLSLRKV